MSPKELGFRVLFLALVTALAAAFGGITAPYANGLILGLIGAGIGFVCALLFTFVAERVIRQNLMQKIGSGPVTWAFVSFALETLTMFGLAAAQSWLFNLHIGSLLVFGVYAAATWYVFGREAFVKTVSLCALYLATRK